MASRLCWSIYSLSWDSCSAPSLAGRPGGRTLSSPPRRAQKLLTHLLTLVRLTLKAGNVSSGMTFLKSVLTPGIACVFLALILLCEGQEIDWIGHTGTVKPE